MQSGMFGAAIALSMTCSVSASAFNYPLPQTKCQGTRGRIRLPVGTASAEALISSDGKAALFQICRPGASGKGSDGIHKRTRLAIHARTAEAQPETTVDLAPDTCVHLSAFRITAEASKSPEDSANGVHIDVCSVRE
jgi:hypothetical protein